MISKANVKNIYPLTPLQEGILFHSLYDNGASYFEQLSYRVRGVLDPALFERAWQELVRRHDVLRTVFVHKDVPRPLQIVLKEWRIEFAVIDLRSADAVTAEERISRFRAEDRGRPFNPAREPLTRVSVLLLADHEAEVIWSHHHIILDGWSVGILQAELLEIYTALREGRRHTLPEPVPFAQYLAWIGRQDSDASRRFWGEELAGYEQAVGLPRCPVTETVAAPRLTVPLQLDPERSSGLAALAAANGVTLNVLLQAVWGLVLCRLNSVEDAVFAATVSGRPEGLFGVERMVGLFINAVPVRVRIDRTDTFDGLLRELLARSLAAVGHHWCSLADIQAATPLKQGLLDHILIFENYPLDERLQEAAPAAGGLTVVRAELRENTNYPFELSIVPGNRLTFTLGFDPAVYPPAQMERTAWALEHLLDQVLEHPGCPLAELDILAPRARREILTRFNRPQGEAADRTVADLLEERVAREPERTALVCGDVRWSYRELNEAANRVANLLQQCAVQPDQVVGILMDRSERMLAALWGVIKSGAAYLPLDPAFPAARIAYMLEDSRCRVLLTEARHRELRAGIAADAVVIELDRLPDTAVTTPHRSTGPEHLLYLIYTSGSTGLPKGVMLEQRNVISFTRNMAQVYGLEAGDTILALTTITFDISVLELICSLLCGMTVVLADDAAANNPARAAALLGRDGINVLQITPSRLKLMLEETELSALSGLKALLIGGEPLPEPLFRRLQGLPATALFNVYGPTEATIWSTTKRLNNAALTIGTPLVDEEVLILSAAGRLMPVGSWGEICIGGQGLARGYWQRPELTADRFIPHPLQTGERLYRTGDLGRFLPDGDIQCGGRMDNQVKVRGYRIETGEIEQTLLKVPGVREAVAHVVEVDGLNEIAAYIVPSGAEAPEVSLIRSVLAESLPAYMLPTYYLTLEQVPLTPNGKTDRKALPLPTGGGQRSTAPGERTAPRTATEARLAAIWQQVLGVEQVGIDDNFFDLGGHSIKAIRIVSAIAKEFGRDIPLADIFRNPTPALLATLLEPGGEAAATEEELAPLPPQPWYPCSPGQRRLWVLQRLAPDSPLYSMPVALRLSGAIDTAALAASLAALAARHEALRTVYPERDGLPVQVILPPPEQVLTMADLRHCPDPWGTALAEARRRADIPFDLAAGPPFTAWYGRTGDSEGLLLLLMHHSNGDGWSWNIMLRELAEGYRDAVEGRPAAAPPPLQYKEWAAAQNRALASGAWAAMADYWHRTLAGAGTPLALPTDFPRPVVRRGAGGLVTHPLSPELVAGLRELAASRDATLFMALLALLKTLLYRLSGQEEITVGIPVAGRPPQRFDGTVGFFVNTLALRDHLDPAQPFSDLLARVRRTALDAYEHQLYPFDLLVSELAVPRDTGHGPLFDVMAVLQEETDAPERIGDLRVAPVSLGATGARFDLTFTFNPTGEGLTLELEYAVDLFLPETAERIVRRFETLARGVVARPETAIERLPLLPPEEAALIAACGTGESHPRPDGTDMVELFRRQAAERPETTAVIAPDRTLSYAELDRLSEQCALRLRRECGVGPETIVGVMTGRSFLLPVALLGILKAGGVYLPIDPGQPESRIRHIIGDSGLTLILADGETLATADACAGGARVLAIAPLPEGDPVGSTGPGPGPDSGAYVIYTSGSTGLPKGTLLQHGGFVNMILDQIRRFGIVPEDRCLLFSSFSFDGAMSEIFLALHSGAALVIAGREAAADPAAFARLLRESGAKVATLPPVYLNALRTSGASLDPLRVVITAGEAAIAGDVLQVARERTVFNAYGPTEASVCSAIHRVEPGRSYHGGIPIGTPMANCELLLLDRLLQPVALGVAGEICIAGPGLARCYLHRPELTAEKFVPHPQRPGERLYRTGDLGRFTGDGTLQFLGRLDDQVKIRGYRIECGEVERALLQHPLVEGALVTARDEGAARELVAFLLAPQRPDPAEVKRFLGDRLPAYMIPTRVVLLEEFPRTPNGKVDRRVLLAGLDSGEHPAPAAVPPQTPMEQRLAGIWEKVLKRGGIGRDDSFFDLGGHSIAAVHLAAAIRDELGVELPLSLVFRFPTLRELARQCDRSHDFSERFDDATPLLLAEGSEGIIFAFPPITGFAIAYQGLARHLERRTVYGFGFVEGEDRLERYCAEIDRLQPAGELTLFGYSSGGNLAFEVVKELERRGRTVARLLLLDSWQRPPGAPVTDPGTEQGELYRPDPALYGDLADLMENPRVRELAFAKLRRYLAYSESVTTTGAIGGDILLVTAGIPEQPKGLTQQWENSTTGTCTVVAGSGGHLAMLHEPWAAANGELVCRYLRGQS